MRLRTQGANDIILTRVPNLPIPTSIDALQTLLQQEQYVADRGLATSVYLALTLQRPLLLEGEAGVGKTEIA